MPSKPGDWKPGDEAKADRLNEWAEYSTGVPFTAGGGIAYGGGSLARQGRGWILAKLSGASSPYSFTSQVDGGSGSLVNGPTTGTSAAYEVNGVSGLNNKVVRLYPDGHGKFNFQYLACCSSCTGTLTVNVKCGGVNRSGATVTITQGSTSYTGTTNGSGNATFTPGLSGTWSITVTLAGFQTYTGTFTFACANLTLNITINGASNTIAGANNVRGCNGVAMSGATVEIRQSGTLYATTTTDSAGGWSSTFAGPSGVYDVTYIKTGFSNFTESTGSLACNGSTTFILPRQLSAAAGNVCYACHGYGTILTSASLTLTVSWAGAQTLAYDSGSSSWRATYVYTGTVWTNAALTTSASTTATIIFFAEPSGPGAGYIAWCLKASGPNAVMSDAFVAANPTLVEQRSLGNSPTVCNNTSPLNVSYGMAEPNTTFTAGTATLTE